MKLSYTCFHALPNPAEMRGFIPKFPLSSSHSMAAGSAERETPIAEINRTLDHQAMQGVRVIERAFQLAPQCRSLAELQRALTREGYSNVIEHLKGPQIRAQITPLFKSGSERRKR